MLSGNDRCRARDRDEFQSSSSRGCRAAGSGCVRPSTRLAQHYRVITFSLCDERTSPFRAIRRSAFENYVEQVDLALDRAGVERAVIAGVSYGGPDRHRVRGAAAGACHGARARFGAARGLATRPPQRGSNPAPLLMSPLFVATAPLPYAPELEASARRWPSGFGFTPEHGWRVTAPMSPRGWRGGSWADAHRFADPTAVRRPALVVTGEPGSIGWCRSKCRDGTWTICEKPSTSCCRGPATSAS